MKEIPHGVDKRNELNPGFESRDIRTSWESFRDYASSPDGILIIAGVAIAFMFVFPQLIEVLALVAFLALWGFSHRDFRLPFRLPATSILPDPSTPKPHPSKPRKPGESKRDNPAGGITFLGNDRRSGEELWLNDSDLRTHMLVLGTTGAGKALPLDTLIHTPTGWRRNRDLKVGDLVSTPDGKSSRITGVFPQGKQALWRLTFADGRTAEVSSNHLWGIGEYISPDPRHPPASSLSANLEALEVMDTVSLARRLANHEWAPEACGLAVPLSSVLNSEPVDFISVLKQVKIETAHPDSASESINSSPTAWIDVLLTGWQQGHYPEAVKDALANASRQQRIKLWQAIIGRFPVVSSINSTCIEIKGKLTPAPIIDLARSLGWLACVETLSGVPTIVIKFNHPGLKIISVEPVLAPDSTSGSTSFAPRPVPVECECQCLKIEASHGLMVIDDWVVTHNTEVLLSIAYNALIQGNGFIYVDGKGDTGLWQKIFSLCRLLGREDDLLVINFIKGGKDFIGPQKNRLSNTFNPFSNGSAAGLTELIVGLMEDSGGDNAMWKGRAVAMIGAIMKALTFLRDFHGLLLDIDTIRQYLLLPNIQKLARRHDIPEPIIKAVKNYLSSLPGYVDGAPKQSETVLDQHGFLQMQFTKIMGSLADTYNHIFNTNLGEVDLLDVVLQRRILVVLLPALENSPDELSNLGKIIVASLKMMMAATLGEQLEGSYQDIIESKPTTSPSPYLVILDEYGYYVVKGAALMPAQARGLGFCMVFAGQDYPSFKKNNNSEEAAATIGNCNVKIFMRVEDPTETFDLAQKTGGEAAISKTGGFSRQTTGLFNNYLDTLNAHIERRHRVDLRDLQAQTPGQAHIFFQSTLVRAQMFYVNPPVAKHMRLNYFLRVEPPEEQTMKDFDIEVSELQNNLLDADLAADTNDDLHPIFQVEVAKDTFSWLLNHQQDSQLAGMGALAAIKQCVILQAKSLQDRAALLAGDNSDGDAHDSREKISVFGRYKYRRRRDFNPHNLGDSQVHRSPASAQPTDASSLLDEEDVLAGIESLDQDANQKMASMARASAERQAELQASQRVNTHPDSPDEADSDSASDAIYQELTSMQDESDESDGSAILASATDITDSSDAEQIIEDMRQISSYPNAIPDDRAEAEILSIIEEIAEPKTLASSHAGSSVDDDDDDD